VTKRPEAMENMAAQTGGTLVWVANHVRSMAASEVPALYNTTLGRGHRHARLRAAWLCSTFLAMVLDDPKNAARRVPTCGNLPLKDTWSAEEHETVRYDLQSQTGSYKEKIIDYSSGSFSDGLGKTLFEVLVNLVESVAMEWDGSVHQLLRKEFRLTISLTEPAWAEMKMFFKQEDNGTVIRIHAEFGTQNTTSSTQAAISRQAIIEIKHIEMLAKLYAGTLTHKGTSFSSTPSETTLAPANAGVETENAGSLAGEPAPSDCQLSALATSDDDTPSQANGLDNRGSNPGVCVSSSGKSVRAGSATSNRRRQHAIEAHHHGSA
jgi:hypothetical protein